MCHLYHHFVWFFILWYPLTILYSDHFNRSFSNLLAVWHLFLKLLRLFTFAVVFDFNNVNILDVTSSKTWVCTVFFGKPSLILPPLEKYWQDTICILICFYVYLCIKISTDIWIRLSHLSTGKGGNVASFVQSKTKRCAISIAINCKL